MSKDQHEIELDQRSDISEFHSHTQLVHRVFESQAEQRPDSIALVSEEEEITYKKLNMIANQVGHALLRYGIEPDDRIGVFAERSKETVVGMLSVLKAGGAYVPLDPHYPTNRLTLMLRDSSPVAIVTTSALAPRLSELSTPLILVDGELPQSTENPLTGTAPHNLAYVMYTSGSTGRPKGVMVEHRNICNLIVGNRYAPLGPQDCVAHCASPSFDATTWEVWAALLNGGRLLIVPQCAVLDRVKLNRTLVERAATAMFLTVGLFNEYVDALEEAFSGLTYLIVGGDTVVPKNVSRALSKGRPPQHLINAYGPTETTTFATTYEIKSVAENAKSIPIGRPIAGACVYILDPEGGRAPAGRAGEIYIGGSGVSRGYLNDLQHTNDRYLSDPFSEGVHARMYRTGDLGYWSADGYIEHIGRNDFQVKIRGFRVELGEIEAALHRFPGVKHAVAVAREEGPGLKRVIGYVVPEGRVLEETPPECDYSRDDAVTMFVQRIRDHLRSTLPEYLLPAVIVALENLPLTPNGKLDRDALPEPESRQEVSEIYMAPRTPTEEALSTIWKDAIRVSLVGVNDNFFELGGDSLIGVEVVGLISDAMGIKLPFMALFQHPTVRQLAQYLDELATKRVTQ